MRTPKRIRPNNDNLPLKYKYADEWLDHAVELFKPIFQEAGYDIPPVVVAAGFSSSGYHPNKKSAIGMCYGRCWSPEGVNQIFIAPVRTDPIDVLWVLGHELIHAVDDCQNGHKKPFYDIAKKIGHWDANGLSFTQMRNFQLTLEGMAHELGRYPRAPFVYTS
jgi:hypothetical protein